MSDPARDLRYARWLLERAVPALGSTPNVQTAIEAARKILEAVAGYQPDEPELFAQLHAASDQQLDLWADLKASDR